LVRLLRQLPGESARLPVIALTAYARNDDRTRSLSAGFQAHLSKPVAPADLLTTIASLCPRSAGAVAG
jgi:CheY-like chemotaxis protein